MKKHIKHKFKYIDPETAPAEKTVVALKNSPKKIKEKPTFLISDLKRTIYIILAFVGLLVILYVVNLKMNFLEPLFKRFL